jgi:hydroxymethylbilane synthase
MGKLIRIGTRESQLATWQAKQVADLLSSFGYDSELVMIKTEGDIDLHTPLYEMGVQGIFTKALDSALLQNKIDIAVHSMKDVPTQLASGLDQVAVLPRGPVNDLIVFKNKTEQEKYSRLSEDPSIPFTVATSSLRRKAQWLHRFPTHRMESLRGNINTRLQKLQDQPWNAAIFAQAGLERINLRPDCSIELDWMLPAPAQGAMVVLGRTDDEYIKTACQHFNDTPTELCTRVERDFLRTLLGGCSAPIGALAEWKNYSIFFKGNIFSLDGTEQKSVQLVLSPSEATKGGKIAAQKLLAIGGQAIIDTIRNDGQ